MEPLLGHLSLVDTARWGRLRRLLPLEVVLAVLERV